MLQFTLNIATVCYRSESELRDIFILEENNKARQKILTALAKQREFNIQDYPSATEWLEPSKASSDEQSSRNESRSGKKPPALSRDDDCAACLQSLRAIPRLWVGRTSPVVFPFKEKLRSYTAWFPVRSNFSIKTPAEKYLPYLGDSDKDREKAQRAFQIMEKEEGKKDAFDLLSDGEIDDESGLFIPEDSEDSITEMFHVDSLGQIRARAAQRHALLGITERYGDKITVLNTLREALGMPDNRYVMAALDVAKKRLNELEKNLQTLKRSRHKARQIRRAIAGPDSHSWCSKRTIAQEGGISSIVQSALKRFCHVCHGFACDLHDECRPIPQLPIADQSREQRLSDLDFGTANECSMRCYMLKKSDQIPFDPREAEPWNEEETQLLHEAVRLLHKDPCSVSIMIGTRCCREVNERMSLASEKGWIQKATDVLKMHQDIQREHILMMESEHGPQDAGGYSSGDDDELLSARVKKWTTKTRSNNQGKTKIRKKERINLQVPRKSSVPREDPDEDLGHWACQPCSHSGSCSTENCFCFRDGRLCESFCACNGERYTFSPRTETILRKGARCTNRATCCECPGGKCDPFECYCFVEMARTCDPDECGCDSDIGPWAISLSERKCKNSEIFRHKRTFVGCSIEAGFGLFAGERFEKGDNIGVYIGAQLPAEIVDGTCAVGDAIGMMYTFDVRNVTIDGTKSGAKVRFINHRDEWESPNCASSEVQLQGQWYNRLTTLRAVEPGEEFFFDYKIVDPNGRADCTYVLPSWLEAKRKKQKQALDGVVRAR